MLVRLNVDLWYKNWKSVPAKQKENIIPVIEESFEYKDLDDDNDDLANVRDGIPRTVADIYSNQKNELNKYFTLSGGNKNALDLATTLSKVPNQMDAAT
ncbi:hypothetical protein PanWU01x14_224100 [Parasponia andersonii]|uniref:Uncharacterized protein n=1 Tax=Parasponia andersonii TaxID=3476 RepID=A0A2P5BNK9_PARAD|nr:hypothetical protein PanWU01x14_224100 [Parasponia andersonii]